MVTPTTHFIPRSDLHFAGPWYFGDYCNIFLPNIGEDQKKSYHLSAGPLALRHMVNLDLVIAFGSLKVR